MSGLSMDQLGSYTTVRTRDPVSEFLRARLPFLRASRSYMTRRFRNLSHERARRILAAGRARQRAADAEIRRRLANRRLIAAREASRRRGSWADIVAREERDTRRDLAMALARRARNTPRVPPTPRVPVGRTWSPSPTLAARASELELASAENRSRRRSLARQARMSRSGFVSAGRMPVASISYFQFR